MPCGQLFESLHQAHSANIPLTEFAAHYIQTAQERGRRPQTRVALIVNPNTGPHKYRKRIPEQADEATTYIQSQSLAPGHHWTAEQHYTTGPGSAQEIVKNLTSQERIPIVIATMSGDGTFGEVINEVAKMPKELRPIVLNVPLGSTNVWARDIALPLNNSVAALKQLFESGAVREIDLGDINSRKFILMAGIGFDAHLTSTVERAPVSNKKIAYAREFVRALPHFQPTPATVEADGKKLAENIPLFFGLISNTQLYAGYLRPRLGYADDGLLEASFLKGTKAVHLLQSLYYILRQSRTIPNNLGLYVQAPSFHISTTRRLPLQADGEYLGAFDEFGVQVDHKAISVLVTPESTRRRHPLFAK